MTRFEVDMTRDPPICLPEGLMRSAHLVDVTLVGSSWRVFLDVATGRLHDGARYAEQMRAEQEQNEG